jgi:hypothetical protein
MVRQLARAHVPGEPVKASHVILPQVRQTHAVLACRCGAGWGYQAGVNEHGVAIGVTGIHTRLERTGPYLTGPDLVRLGLERGSSARQAMEVVTDLINRHGQTGDVDTESQTQEGTDSALLIADGQEAYFLEACGAHWAMQMIGSVRAVSNVCHLRQDWNRISRGLADLAIEHGWWPANGSKLDFAEALGCRAEDHVAAMRRWGRATLQLETHSGQIDPAFVCRLLGEIAELPPPDPASLPGARLRGQREEGQEEKREWPTADRSDPGARMATTSASLVIQVGASNAAGPRLPMLWCAFGSPGPRVYFPLYLAGELPAEFLDDSDTGCALWRELTECQAECQRNSSLRHALQAEFDYLQERFDQTAREFLAEALALEQRSERVQLERLAGSFMQHNVERFEEVLEGLRACAGRRRGHGYTHEEDEAGWQVVD